VKKQFRGPFRSAEGASDVSGPQWVRSRYSRDP